VLICVGALADLVEQRGKVIGYDLVAFSVLSNVLSKHREAMNVVLKEYKLALAAQLKDSEAHIVGLIAQPVILNRHNLARRESLEHFIWCHLRGDQDTSFTVSTFSGKAATHVVV